MKRKILPAMLAACLVSAVTVDAYAAIGRSGGGSRPSFSRAVSAPKAPSAPYSKPAASPAPARPGGIGGTTGSVGVRKPEVTQQVANKVNPQPATSPSTVQSRPAYAPTNPATTPVYSQSASNVTNGSTFMSSLGGSFVGSALGNMIFGNHGSSGSTTVINNGTGGSAAPAATTTAGPSAGPTTYVDSNGVVTSQQHQPQSYGLWGFIKDVFLIGVLVLLIGGIGFVFYQGFKKLKAYWNRERGIAPVQPVNPTQMFWRIQQMHSEGSVSGLTELLGPDVIDELTQNLQPYTLLISQVSHEVVLSNAREFSVHYTFYEDSTKLDQVWHYELINGSWKLNGIENIEAC